MLESTDNVVGYIYVCRPPTVGNTQERVNQHYEYMKGITEKGGKGWLENTNNVPQHMGGLMLDYEGARIYAQRGLYYFDAKKIINDESAMLTTHSTHTFVSTAFGKKAIYINGYFSLPDGSKRYLSVRKEYGEMIYDCWIPIRESYITEKPLPMVYRNLEPLPLFKIKERDSLVQEGKIRMLKDSSTNNPPKLPICEAIGSIYISRYSEEDGKAKFTYAFYGNVDGEYVGIDENSRGSLTPNYKALLTGYGIIRGEERQLIFSFKYHEKHYVFRYVVNGKPDTSKSYHVSTDEARTKTLLRETPDDFIVGEGTPKPEFVIIDSSGKKREPQSNNEIGKDDVFVPKKKKDMVVSSMEDAAKVFNPDSHIKERPEPIRPEEGLVNKKAVLDKAGELLKNIRANTDDIIAFKREGDRSIEINLAKSESPDSVITLRIVCGKKEVSVQYLSSQEKWVEIKRFTADEQGKSLGRLISVIKKNIKVNENGSS